MSHVKWVKLVFQPINWHVHFDESLFSLSYLYLPFKEVPNERGFTSWILSHQEDHRLRIEIWIFKLRAVEIVEESVFL